MTVDELRPELYAERDRLLQVAIDAAASPDDEVFYMARAELDAFDEEHDIDWDAPR